MSRLSLLLLLSVVSVDLSSARSGGPPGGCMRDNILPNAGSVHSQGVGSHGVNIQLISVVGNAWELSFSHGGTIKGIKIKALNDGEFDGWDTSLYSDSNSNGACLAHKKPLNGAGDPLKFIFKADGNGTPQFDVFFVTGSYFDGDSTFWHEVV